MHHATPTALVATPYGQLSIFLRSGEKLEVGSWREWLNNPPLHLRILHQARRFGLTHGMVKHCVSDFAAQGQVEHDHFEYGNSRLPLCVELLGPRGTLEAFCRASAELLRGRFMVYKDIERWGWEEAADAQAAYATS